MRDLRFRRKRKKSKGRSLRKRRLHFAGREAGLSIDREKESVLSKKDCLVWALEILLVCILAVVLVWFFGQRVSNAGDSMKPVLSNGDVVLVNRLVYNAAKPGRGDIIAFRPGGNENVHYSVKRIVGLPGETVEIKEGSIYIDGEEMKEDIYVSDIDYAGVAGEPIQLGEDEYFVMGDNQAGSDDSRMADIGNVKRNEIYGKVWFVISLGSHFGPV